MLFVVDFTCMLNKQVKSPCCRASAIRFGGRRRQCRQCGSTWRIRHSRRGRKPLRLRREYLDKVFKSGLRIRHITTTKNVSSDATRKRFAVALNALVKQPRRIRLPAGKLTLIIDAEWRKFEKKCWTLYCLALKPVDKDEAIILDPILRPEKESTETWEAIICCLSKQLKKRIIAVVSDGIRGFFRVTTAHDWKWQRCHFHLLFALQKRRGKRLSTHGRITRENIYQTVRRLLSETSKKRFPRLQARLERLKRKPDCPKRMRMIVNGFLREFSYYRTYLDFPELNLPTTTGVMESINSRLKQKSLTVRTPNAWRKWTIATIRYKPVFKCKRAKLPTKLIP